MFVNVTETICSHRYFTRHDLFPSRVLLAIAVDMY